jgi:hypothetical protein
VVLRIVSIVAAMAALVPPAAAMWRMPSEAPVGRLITNAGKYIAEHPADAEGYYILGRVHGLAFTMKARLLNVWSADHQREREQGQVVKQLPDVCTDDFQWSAEDWAKKNPGQALTRDELVRHLTEAVKNLGKAVELDPKPALPHLGLAYVLEQGAAMAGDCDIARGSGAALADAKKAEIEASIKQLGSEKDSERAKAVEALRGRLAEAVPVLVDHRKDENAKVREGVRELLSTHWRRVAIAEYFATYERSIGEDIKITEQPMRGLETLASYEAMTGFVRLVKAEGAADDAEKVRLAKVEGDLKTLEKKPPNGAMTPIILSIDAPLSLTELLAPETTVGFHLDGTDREQAWPWVKPRTGILVWDPEHKGHITSGQQLFGSATWWMFFTDGYHALDALDDNRDGKLSGSELRGLAVWFDRNSNGVSDPGEVVPTELLGIESIATRAESMEGESPANQCGLVMQDGRVLPTYDWMAYPATSKPEVSTRSVP